MEHEPVDVLIIGAGASGAAIAYSLLETRMRILCLEQGGHLTDAEYPSRKEDYELSRYAEFSCDPNVRGLKQDYPINSKLKFRLYNKYNMISLYCQLFFLPFLSC